MQYIKRGMDYADGIGKDIGKNIYKKAVLTLGAIGLALSLSSCIAASEPANPEYSQSSQQYRVLPKAEKTTYVERRAPNKIEIDPRYGEVVFEKIYPESERMIVFITSEDYPHKDNKRMRADAGV